MAVMVFCVQSVVLAIFLLRRQYSPYPMLDPDSTIMKVRGKPEFYSLSSGEEANVANSVRRIK